MYNHATRGCQKLLQAKKNPARITTNRAKHDKQKSLPRQKVTYSVTDRSTILYSLISIIILIFLSFITRAIPILNTTSTAAFGGAPFRLAKCTALGSAGGGSSTASFGGNGGKGGFGSGGGGGAAGLTGGYRDWETDRKSVV